MLHYIRDVHSFNEVNFALLYCDDNLLGGFGRFVAGLSWRW